MARSSNRKSPPGRTKIIEAMRSLLAEKNFDAIKTADIAAVAGVTEGLIYKYFRDKRALLYEVLRQHFDFFWQKIQTDLMGIEGALNKLRRIIWTNLDVYANHKVFARIVLLEVRNAPDYFESAAYALEKEYNRLILDVIDEGVRRGEIRADIQPSFLRAAIHGAIENACLQGVIFNRPLSSAAVAENICKILFEGVCA